MTFYLSCQEYFWNEYVNTYFYNTETLWQQVFTFLVKVLQFKTIHSSPIREHSPWVQATSEFWTGDPSPYFIFLSPFHFLLACLPKVLTESKSYIAPMWSVHLQIKHHIRALPWKGTSTQACERPYAYLSPYNIILELHQCSWFLLPLRLSFLLNFFQVSLSF